MTILNYSKLVSHLALEIDPGLQNPNKHCSRLF